MNKRFANMMLILALALALAACAPTPTAAPPTPTPAPPAATPTAVRTVAPTLAPPPAPPTPTPSAFPLTITDGASRRVAIAKQPQKIVSLAPSNSEILFAIGQGSKLVAVDDFSDYPAEAKPLPKVGGFKLNFEQIVALNPDLVLVAGGITSADNLKKLEELKLTVVVVGSAKTTMDSVMSDIVLVGKVMGASDKAEALTGSMKRKLDELIAKGKTAWAVSQPKVYWELDATDPSKPYAVGPGNFINDIIALAGGKNVFADAGAPFAQVSSEQVVAANPDVIILSDAAYGVTVESVKARKGWDTLNAVKKNKVFPIDDNLVSRPGPRVVEGLEAALKLIHSDIFK